MHKLLGLVLGVAAVAGCDRKLGIAGATCAASADCADELQCIASTCVDPAALAKARDAEQAELAASGAGQTAAMAKLMAELKDLKAEQERLEQEKQALDSKLGRVIDETEKQRLLTEKAALDAKLGDNAGKLRPKRPTSKPSSAHDPLQDL